MDILLKMFRKKDEGFTLVELMVVVLIIGILVAIAIPVFNSARASAQKSACLANMRTVNGAVQQYIAVTGLDAPTSLADAKAKLSPAYVKVWPKCPAQPTVEYTYDTTGTITCTYEGHVLP